MSRQSILRMSACHHCMNCYEATAQHTLEEYSVRGQLNSAVPSSLSRYSVRMNSNILCVVQFKNRKRKRVGCLFLREEDACKGGGGEGGRAYLFFRPPQKSSRASPRRV